MRLITLAIALAAGLGALSTYAQGQAAFKLGTFERQGGPSSASCSATCRSIDFAAAHAAIRTPASRVAAPTDMKDLIVRYDTGLRARIGESSARRAAGAARPPYVHDLSALKDPAADHVSDDDAQRGGELPRARHRDGAGPRGFAGPAAPTAGGALPGTTARRASGNARQDDTRWNPFMFLKAPAAIIADGEADAASAGRTQIEWECELGVVIGRTGQPCADRARDDYIFGYTLENDVSDRGGRGDTRYGSDWLVTKYHDTFAPMGPFITPKEFVRDSSNLTIGSPQRPGAAGRQHRTDDSHRVRADCLRDRILSLRPGDVIATARCRRRVRAHAAHLPQGGRGSVVHLRRNRHAQQSSCRGAMRCFLNSNVFLAALTIAAVTLAPRFPASAQIDFDIVRAGGISRRLAPCSVRHHRGWWLRGGRR